MSIEYNDPNQSFSDFDKHPELQELVISYSNIDSNSLVNIANALASTRLRKLVLDCPQGVI